MFHVESTSECLFDCKRSGSCLLPVIFNYRTNLDHERYYHSFVGEIACGRWAISRLRTHSWKLYSIGYVIVTRLKRFLNTMVVFTNYNGGVKIF